MARIKKWEMFENQSSDLLGKLPKEIKDVKDVEKLILTLALEGKLFHFDDDPHDLSGDPFTKEEADLIEKLINESFAVCEKHYKNVDHKLKGAGFWDGIIKGVYGIGYIAFGAGEQDDMKSRVYVARGNGEDVRETTLGKLREFDKNDKHGKGIDIEKFDRWFDGLKKVGETVSETVVMKASKPAPDITGDGKKSIAAKVSPLITRMGSIPTNQLSQHFQELKKEFLDILNDPNTVASDHTRNKWKNVVNAARDAKNLLFAMTNLYLAGAGMKVDDSEQYQRTKRITLYEDFFGDDSKDQQQKIESTNPMEWDGDEDVLIGKVKKHLHDPENVKGPGTAMGRAFIKAGKELKMSGYKVGLVFNKYETGK